MDFDDVENVSILSKGVQWAEERPIYGDNIAPILSESEEKIEPCLPLAAFLHGQKISRAQSLSACMTTTR